MGIENPMDFVDATDVDLIGVMNTVAASMPHLPDGAAIVVTGSNAGLMPGTTETGSMGAGGPGYSWSKKTLVGYVEQMALILAARLIRVNAIHPTNCQHPPHPQQGALPGVPAGPRDPTREDVIPAFTYFQAMPIPYVEPVDISNAVLFLSCDESRYVTGQQLRVDAGSLLRGRTGRNSGPAR